MSEIVSSRNILFYFRHTEKHFVHLVAIFIQELGKLKRLSTVFQKRDNIFQFFARLKFCSLLGGAVALLLFAYGTADSLWKYIDTFYD